MCSWCCDDTEEKRLRKRRENTGYGVQQIYREREQYGVSYLANQMRIYNREQYFK